MDKRARRGTQFVLGLIIAMILLFNAPAEAAIDGITGTTTFNLVARSGYIGIADGANLLMWGYADGNGIHNGGRMQFPGPTLIVNEGDLLTINLANELTVPVSIVFPGQSGVTATGGVPGLLTREAPPAGTVTYTFTATNPGTYLYHSGTQPELQVEMGLVGALIVRPLGVLNQAYSHADSQFDHEYLFLLSEADPSYHNLVAEGKMDEIDMTTRKPNYWFINGRAAPDTMAPASSTGLPHQPYNCMPMTHPGEKVLMRLIGAGFDSHPFHHHGNHTYVIAREGRLLESVPGAGADNAELEFTITVSPGKTVDAIYIWTGEGLGWDFYGHQPGDPMQPGECPGGPGPGCDHGIPFPVLLPHVEELDILQHWSGSPFLGTAGFLPPGVGGYNPNAGYFFMMHSHNEVEMTNNNIFPGGMMTMIVIEHPSVVLMNP